MSRLSTFAGLEILEPGDPLSTDGSQFTGRDRQTIDGYLSQMPGHRHTGDGAIASPTQPLTAVMSSTGGSLPADTPLWLTYTVIDQFGGETAAAPVVTLTTGVGIGSPASAIVAELSNAGGILTVNQFQYCYTLVDDSGGESAPSPGILIDRLSGPASAQVEFTGMLAVLAANPTATGWRLYKSTGGAVYNLLAALGAVDGYTDDGTVGLNYGVQPPEIDTTGQTASVAVTVPSATASAGVSFVIYLSTSASFTSPSQVGEYDLIDAGSPITISSLATNPGSPPRISTAVRSPSKIDPDTELLNWHWKTPVSASGLLPLGSAGDVRLSMDDGVLYAALDDDAGVGGNGWTPLGSAGAGGGSASIAFQGSGGIGVEVQEVGGTIVVTIGGGSEVVSGPDDDDALYADVGFLASAVSGLGTGSAAAAAELTALSLASGIMAEEIDSLIGEVDELMSASGAVSDEITALAVASATAAAIEVVLEAASGLANSEIVTLAVASAVAQTELGDLESEITILGLASGTQAVTLSAAEAEIVILGGASAAQAAEITALALASGIQAVELVDASAVIAGTVDLTFGLIFSSAATSAAVAAEFASAFADIEAIDGELGSIDVTLTAIESEISILGLASAAVAAEIAAAGSANVGPAITALGLASAFQAAEIAGIAAASSVLLNDINVIDLELTALATASGNASAAIAAHQTQQDAELTALSLASGAQGAVITILELASGVQGAEIAGLALASAQASGAIAAEIAALNGQVGVIQGIETVLVTEVGALNIASANASAQVTMLWTDVEAIIPEVSALMTASGGVATHQTLQDQEISALALASALAAGEITILGLASAQQAGLISALQTASGNASAATVSLINALGGGGGGSNPFAGIVASGGHTSAFVPGSGGMVGFAASGGVTVAITNVGGSAIVNLGLAASGQQLAVDVHDSITMPNLSAGSLAKLVINTVRFDSTGWWDSTNKRFQPKQAGYYLCGAAVVDTLAGMPVGAVYDVGIAKNGTAVDAGVQRYFGGNVSWGGQGGQSWLVFLNGTTDYIEAYGNSSNASRTVDATMWAVGVGVTGLQGPPGLTGSTGLTGGTGPVGPGGPAGSALFFLEGPGASAIQIGVNVSSAGIGSAIVSVTSAGVSASYTALIGDNFNSTLAVAHMLGTTNVIAQVAEASGSRNIVDAGIQIIDANTIHVTFFNAPGPNQYIVTVMAGGTALQVKQPQFVAHVVGSNASGMVINELDFQASGAASAVLTPEGGGSALVTFTVAPAPPSLSPPTGAQVSTPTRVFATAYQPSPTRATFITQSVYLQSNSAGQQAYVQGYIGPTAASVLSPFTGGKISGYCYLVTAGVTDIGTISNWCAMVPPGWYYATANLSDPVAVNFIETTCEVTL